PPNNPRDQIGFAPDANTGKDTLIARQQIRASRMPLFHDQSSSTNEPQHESPGDSPNSIRALRGLPLMPLHNGLQIEAPTTFQPKSRDCAGQAFLRVRATHQPIRSHASSPSGWHEVPASQLEVPHLSRTIHRSPG